ncbi:MAG: ABC transporter ATP-binding protein, partial [Planctomycetota bacterium]|nr:ABC transporter ATP-binding protein [Planctomycetota bacterium]
NDRIEVFLGDDLISDPGDTVAIIGPSGSGKSTLLGCLAGLEQADSGQVVIAGQDLAALKISDLAAFRGRAMGFVFQSYRLLPALTAEENVRVPLELAGDPKAAERAAHWLDRVGLAERRHHRPAKLSGGEQQRVALARALAPEPAVVFADEPTGNLDAETGAAMAELLFELPAAHGATLIYVTHDRALANRAQRVFALHEGRLNAVPAAKNTAP